MSQTHSPEANPLHRFMTEEAAAAFLDRSVLTLRTWAARRRGPPRIKAMGAVMYDREALAAWLLSNQTDPEAARRAARA
jgi:hypothetical protein